MTSDPQPPLPAEAAAAEQYTAPTEAAPGAGENDTPTDHTSSYRSSSKLTISEEATLASSKRFKPPKFLKVIFETPFRTKNPTHGGHVEEATAWAMDAAGRGPLNQAGSYIGVAILRLATIDAGCDLPATCSNRVYGFKPSSMLTMASVITGVASALLMPFIGAIVDHTRHRKTVGVITAILVSAITGFQTTISLDTWFACLVLEMLGGFTLIMHFMAVMAYLPDLTEVEYELTHYTSRFNICMYMVQLFYVVFLIGMTYGIGLNTVETARVAAAGALVISAVLFFYSWTFLFRKRPALSKVKEGDHLLTSGFKQLWRTSKKIFYRYSSLKWFMLALLFSPEAGAGVVLSVVVTFLAVTLQMTGIEVGITSLIMLLITVPGSLFSNWFMRKYNPLNSFRFGLVFLIMVIAATIGFLDRPSRKNWTFFIAIFWGIAYGWIFPSQRTLQVTLTPRGQETEIMGMFTFVTQVIGWLPALIFSIMNERGIDMRWGVSILCWMMAISVALLSGVGKYEDAVKQVKEEGEREQAELAATAAEAAERDVEEEVGDEEFVGDVDTKGEE